MEKDLRLIDDWLQRHAPQLYARLNPPADEAQLATLQARLGKALPDDFRKLYRWHNGLGDGNLFYGYDFFPVGKILQQHDDFLARGRAYREEMAADLTRCDVRISLSGLLEAPGWVCLGDDGARTGLYLDLHPGAAGRYGQVIFIDPVYGLVQVIADSVAQLVADTAHDMQAGKYALETEMAEADGQRLIVAGDIDVLNWHNSVRWQHFASTQQA